MVEPETVKKIDENDFLNDSDGINSNNHVNMPSNIWGIIKLLIEQVSDIVHSHSAKTRLIISFKKIASANNMKDCNAKAFYGSIGINCSVTELNYSTNKID